MKRISRAKRAFLLAVARNDVCHGCRSASGQGYRECGPCQVKRVDRVRAQRASPNWVSLRSVVLG